MSDEHDSWFKDAFGVDLGEAANKLKEGASAAVGQVSSTVSNVVQGVEGAVEGAIEGVSSAAGGVVKKIAGAVSPSGSSASGSGGGGTGSFPLGGSVGRGGKNAPNDVRAVQTALGVGADGQCGGQTIAAIEAFQRNMGQQRPDGRVDAGGGTERALAGGSKTSLAAPKEDDLRGLAGEPENSPGDAVTGDAADLVDEVIEKAVELSRQGIEVAKDLLAELEETVRLVRASADGCETQAIGVGLGAAGIIVTVTAFIVTGALAPETAGVSLGAWIGLLGGLLVALVTLTVSYQSLIQCQEKRLSDLIKETNQQSKDAARDRELKELKEKVENLKNNRDAIEKDVRKLKDIANRARNLKRK